MELAFLGIPLSYLTGSLRLRGILATIGGILMMSTRIPCGPEGISCTVEGSPGRPRGTCMDHDVVKVCLASPWASFGMPHGSIDASQGSAAILGRVMGVSLTLRFR